MPRSRFDELVALAEDNDGLVTADQARAEGFTDSVLARLVQRRRIVRIARGVYRIPYLSPGRFSQYREVVLWAKANRGPDSIAISHATALVVYGISDANPASIHLTVPRSARLRRKMPKGVTVHRRDLSANNISLHEGIPVTTIETTITDLLQSGGRTDLLKQAISDARREGYISDPEAAKLRRRIESHLKSLRSVTKTPEPKTA
jgi:predicted transcriptional regulator of viral defense system